MSSARFVETPRSPTSPDLPESRRLPSGALVEAMQIKPELRIPPARSWKLPELVHCGQVSKSDNARQ